MNINRVSIVFTSLLSLAGAGCLGDPADAEDPSETTESGALYGSPIGAGLSPGQVLGSGQSLLNNGYELVMQSDCNLVLYDVKDAAGCDLDTHARVLWSSKTWGKGATNSCYATMQTDGNLVVYTSNVRALWASGTNGRANGGYLTVQADGNAVIYANNSAKWATNTNVNPSSGPRACPVVKRTYCCGVTVLVDRDFVRAKRCKLLTGSKTCSAGVHTLTCNGFATEDLEPNGDLTCR